MCYPNQSVNHERHRSIAAAVALSLLHVPCCALPLAALVLGAGGVVAPWAARWAAWAEWTLPVAFGVLALSWWRVSGPHRCARIRRQRRILAGVTVMLISSIVAEHFVIPTVAVATAAH
jgi:hypothetical protein